ncbi:MAG TPA: DUF1365 domain-containing protein, partial [Aquabacterium sp.]|nr:DUF1365 domain-containing protein [Aquabacterium sp.]
MSAPLAAPQPLLMLGQVRHTRLRPRHHAFAYGSYCWMLPMRQLRQAPHPVVNRNRWGWLSFHDADHGLGGPDALAWLDELLTQADLGDDAWRGGEVWLQTFPRVLGFAFKPVSFWWVHRADRSLAAVVAEVNNTFGERHAYVLHGPALRLGQEIAEPKVFHVSPFCEARGGYRFRFMRTGDWGTGAAHGRALDRVLVCVDHDDDAGPLLRTSQSGELHPLTPQTARQAFWGWPLMTWGVLARI